MSTEEPKTTSAQPTPSTAPPEPAQPTETAPPKTNHDEEDVKSALARHTFDGKGANAVPPSDFKGFATEGVEKKPLKSVEEVTQEVLNGNWGMDVGEVARKLDEAGYNVDEVEKEFNRRKKSGAPSAF